MDIIDVMLARAMTPQGQTETYVSIAEAAAAKAEKAKQDAQAAIDVVTSAAEDITAAQEAAADLLASAQEALETAQEAQINTLDTEDVDDEIKKMIVNSNTVTGTTANTLQVITTYPDNTLNTQNITKLYKSTGNNEDGTMTQKAITSALSSKADATTAATKQYVDQRIASAPSGGGGNVNLGSENAGYLVVVNEYGGMSASSVTEEQVIDALNETGVDYINKDEVGLEIDYQNKTCTRVQKAIGLEMGTDFDGFIMYGGRKRCNVADDGTINAFYGDNSYREDGSNGQVMVYQPKFYYKRVPLKLNNKIVRQETLILSTKKKKGFKVHPIFDAGNNEEYEYVLFSAYEGAINNNLMSSIVGVQPSSNMTISEAETYASTRGEGWHIMNMAAISANQMLEIIEFGQMNGQDALEDGISNLTYTANKNCSAITGSTSELGNITGYATTTISDNNGTEITNTTAGKRAISYRGIENPWGNIWNMIGGINIKGDGYSQGGAPYICMDFNYTPSIISNNYEYIGFNLPSTYGWISAMGYGDEKYDWIYMPAECASSANSLAPVGDNLWTVGSVNENKVVAIGGTYGFGSANGPFYYACDSSSANSKKHNYSARLMFIPTKNTIYEQNVSKWTAHMGG